jgi:hypothetical protein
MAEEQRVRVCWTRGGTVIQSGNGVLAIGHEGGIDGQLETKRF